MFTIWHTAGDRLLPVAFEGSAEERRTLVVGGRQAGLELQASAPQRFSRCVVWAFRSFSKFGVFAYV